MAKSTNINNRRYLGNKYKLLPFIKKVVDSECTDIEIVVDIFSGTGAVASAFQDKQLITNDILYSNYISNFAWFSPRKYSRKKIETIIDEYNAMVINEENYMTINFSNTYFSHDDCSKIGYIREDIETKYANKEINERERALLITSLLYAMDKIAKTCGHYDAYRQGVEFDMHLELLLPEASITNNKKNKCYNIDSNDLAGKIVADLVYIDPPYNSRQYCDAYHLLENVARWEKPEVFGVAKKMDRTALKSKYCTKSAAEAFDDLIKQLKCRYIVLSYNNMDTNGRRNDVINALQGYLTILDDIQNEQKMNWASMPESLAQYEFYRQAIELSPEVFGKHGPYDKLAETLERNKDFATAVQTQDMEWIQKNSFMFQSLVKQFDLGIEDRARHYTSNLVKLGFTDEGREISPVGELLLDLKKLRKDDLETMLPIDGVNIVYLRQLMKLRLFDTEGERYYSPFNLAIFALLKRHRLSENEFSELVQGLSPYSDFSDIEQYVLNYREGDIVSGVSIDIPAEIHTNERVSETVFRDNYKNRKSNAGVDIYWVYYNLLFDYLENPSSATIDKLLTFF